MYCAWQKETIENLKDLLREFYPKNRDLSRVNRATLKKPGVDERQAKNSFAFPNYVK